MADFFGNDQRVSSALLMSREILCPAFRMEGSPSNGTLISFDGKPAGSPFLPNGKSHRAVFRLKGNLLSGIFSNMEIISAARGMGKEARDA